MRTLHRTVVGASLAVATIFGCSGGAPAADVTGTWTGTWNSDSGQQGTVTITAQDTGGNVTGTGVVKAGYNASGSLSSNYSSSSGKWTGSVNSSLGKANFDLTVSGNSANGTYSTSIDKGTVAIARSGGGNVNPSPGCADNGQSCTQDGTVTKWKGQCSSMTNSQAPCYCAAAATYACFLAHGCYKEAGVMTMTTQAQLQQGCSTSTSQASQLGTNCGITCQ